MTETASTRPSVTVPAPLAGSSCCMKPGHRRLTMLVMSATRTPCLSAKLPRAHCWALPRSSMIVLPSRAAAWKRRTAARREAVTVRVPGHSLCCWEGSTTGTLSQTHGSAPSPSTNSASHRRVCSSGLGAPPSAGRRWYIASRLPSMCDACDRRARGLCISTHGMSSTRASEWQASDSSKAGSHPIGLDVRRHREESAQRTDASGEIPGNNLCASNPAQFADHLPHCALQMGVARFRTRRGIETRVGLQPVCGARGRPTKPHQLVTRLAQELLVGPLRVGGRIVVAGLPHRYGHVLDSGEESEPPVREVGRDGGCAVGC